MVYVMSLFAQCFLKGLRLISVSRMLFNMKRMYFRFLVLAGGSDALKQKILAHFIHIIVHIRCILCAEHPPKGDIQSEINSQIKFMS